MKRLGKIEVSDLDVGDLILVTGIDIPDGYYIVRNITTKSFILETTDLRSKDRYLVPFVLIEQSAVKSNRYKILDKPKYKIGDVVGNYQVADVSAEILTKNNNKIRLHPFYEVFDTRDNNTDKTTILLNEDDFEGTEKKSESESDNDSDLEMLELEAEALELELKLLNYGKEEVPPQKVAENDYPIRNGNVTSDILKKTFGFRHVNVDINLDEKEEQDMLNVSYDTFRQLAMYIRQPMIAIGLGRNLTLNIGVMKLGVNTGGAYYPRFKSLNFKTLEEFKHIAHEWMHAFDHYLYYTFSEDPKNSNATLMSDGLMWQNRDNSETKQAFFVLVNSMKNTAYYNASKRVADITRNKYWVENCEMLSRAFEVYMNEKMEEYGEENTHLVSLYPNNPYPDYKIESDRKIKNAFDKLFSTLTIKKLNYDTESLFGNN